jgi:tRNA(adenine34) deaminase
MTSPASRPPRSSGSEPPDELDLSVMQQALGCAAAAGARGEVPVGAVIVDGQRRVLASAGNSPIADGDPTAHAEIVALRAAAQTLGNYRLPGCSLYATLEPCVMCVGALLQARISRIVFAARDPKAGACGSVFDLAADPRMNHRIEVTGGVLEDASARLLKDFFAERR